MLKPKAKLGVGDWDVISSIADAIQASIELYVIIVHFDPSQLTLTRFLHGFALPGQWNQVMSVLCCCRCRVEHRTWCQQRLDEMNIKVGWHHTFCSASTTAFPRARIINRTTYIIPTILKNSNDGHKDRNCADQRCARASDSENTSSASGARSVGAGGSGGGKRGGGKSGKAGKNRGAAPAQGQSQQRDKEKGKSLKAPPGAQGHQKSDEARTSPSSPTEASSRMLDLRRTGQILLCFDM